MYITELRCFNMVRGGGVALLLCISKVSGSNIGLETDYHDSYFHDLLQSLQENAAIVP